MPEFKRIQLYPLFLNNELCQYHCLYSDKATIEDLSNEKEFEMSLEASDFDDNMTKANSNDSVDNMAKSRSHVPVGKGLMSAPLKVLAADDSNLAPPGIRKVSGHNAVATNLESPIKVPKEKVESEAPERSSGTLDSLGCFRSFYQHALFN